MPPFAPPIKCQGIKTKLTPAIKAAVNEAVEGLWIEPFCGSCSVAFNIKPQRALLTDTNKHIIKFYQDIQNGSITPGGATAYLQKEGGKLVASEGAYYYEVRERFNEVQDSLDFLFLNRACFNGVMRFNRHGRFNVPFCHKPNRFAQAYVTKISNQIKGVSDILEGRQWTFDVCDFTETINQVNSIDLLYVDPPYAGRNTDYFNSWSEDDETMLTQLLQELPCRFILSTWEKNVFRENMAIQQHWRNDRFSIISIEHFYHVGSSEDLRHSMLEAIITNYPTTAPIKEQRMHQLALTIDTIE